VHVQRRTAFAMATICSALALTSRSTAACSAST